MKPVEFDGTTRPEKCMRNPEAIFHGVEIKNIFDATKRRIISRKELAPGIKQLDIEATDIAEHAKAGQFIMVMAGHKGERIPLTLYDWDLKEGRVSMVFLEIGATTKELGGYNVGDSLAHVLGPLGRPTHVKKYGRVGIVVGGVGAPAAYSVAKAMKEAGNEVHIILGARTSDMLVLKKELGRWADSTAVTTEDGSEGIKGVVTDPLKKKLDGLDFVFTVGPMKMMAAVAEATRGRVKTVASINTIMVDATGMCGGCLVPMVGGGKDKPMYACCDGPDFDAHQVDWDSVIRSNSRFIESERMLLEKFESRRPGTEEDYPAIDIPPSLAPTDLKPIPEGLQNLTPKERMKLPHISVPERDPLMRIGDFREVQTGYSEADAVVEAARCIGCGKCVKKCPVGVRVDEVMDLVRKKEFADAGRIVLEDDPLAGICARVCPQERQCQSVCPLLRTGRSVGIGYVERFLADFYSQREPLKGIKKTGRKVAVVGSGPGGLTCAAELAKKGHDVEVFEALHEPGGVLSYGIPPFRLPRSVLWRDIEYVLKLGVKINLDRLVGSSPTFEQTLKKYDAVFLAPGAGTPNSLGIPGEELSGVTSANEFLIRVNMMRAGRGGFTPIYVGEKVYVIGGGNVAMDAARNAGRLGKIIGTDTKVRILYRRDEENMPARLEEREHAKQEGVEIMPLIAPVRLLGEKGRVTGIEVVNMRLKEPEPGGRKSVEPVPNTNHTIDADQVIVAIGQKPNPLLIERLPGDIQLEKGRIVVGETMATTNPKIFAGGDIAATEDDNTVIAAMKHGKTAAQMIDIYLRSK